MSGMMIIVIFLLTVLWIPVLVIGVKRIKQGYKGAGVLVTVIAGIWGLVAIPLGGLLLIGSVFYFALKEVAPQSFDPKTYKGETGTVSLTWEGQAAGEFRNEGTGTTYSVKTDNGTFTLPVGRWSAKRINLFALDDHQQKWTATFAPSGRFDVKKDSVYSLTGGTPFQASIAINRNINHSCMLGFDLKDASGNKATIVNNSNWNNPPPAFKVLDPDKNVVWQQRFKYG